MKDLENCEYLSSLECVDRKKDIFFNIIILSKKHHLKKQFEENNLDDNMALVVSDSGYSNNEISLEQLKHFDKHTWKK